MQSFPPPILRGRVRDDPGRRALAGARVKLVAESKASRRVVASGVVDHSGGLLLKLSRAGAEALSAENVRLRVHGGGRDFEITPDWAELLAGEFDVRFALPDPDGPWIASVGTRHVHPGSFVEIDGAGFGEDYGAVRASVGAREMVVLDVRPAQLLVRIPPTRGELNPLVVEVAGASTQLDDAFEWAEPVVPTEVGTAGAPATFVGSGDGGTP